MVGFAFSQEDFVAEIWRALLLRGFDVEVLRASCYCERDALDEAETMPRASAQLGFEHGSLRKAPCTRIVDMMSVLYIAFVYSRIFLL